MDFTQQAADLAVKGKGLIFIIFPISKQLLMQFPQPRTDVIEEYLNFSDDPSTESANPKIFNPALHLFHIVSAQKLIMGLVGPAPAIFNWSKDWLETIKHDTRWSNVIKSAKIMMAEELAAGDGLFLSLKNDDPFAGSPLAYTDDELAANEADSHKGGAEVNPDTVKATTEGLILN
jgi:hypothetical protein